MSDKEKFEKIDEVMNSCPVVPVLVIDNVKDARPLAEALVSAGVTTLEVTLRTSCALEVIREMSLVEGALVGAGTVLNPQQLEAALEAGAQFMVSPGITVSVTEAARRNGVPYLPGVANASEVMLGLDLGLQRFKFFPAGLIGGMPALKAYSSVFPDVRWMPSGGVNEENFRQWLAMPTVAAVGGSWLTAGNAPPELVHQRAMALGLKNRGDTSQG